MGPLAVVGKRPGDQLGTYCSVHLFYSSPRASRPPWENCPSLEANKPRMAHGPNLAMDCHCAALKLGMSFAFLKVF